MSRRNRARYFNKIIRKGVFMSTFERDLDNIVLLAYSCKETKKIGSMRIAENDPEKLEELVSFMVRDLQGVVYGMILQKLDSPKAKQQEIEEQIRYLKGLEITTLIPKNYGLKVAKRRPIQHVTEEYVKQMLEAKEQARNEAKAQDIAEELIKNE